MSIIQSTKAEHPTGLGEYTDTELLAELKSRGGI